VSLPVGGTANIMRVSVTERTQRSARQALGAKRKDIRVQPAGPRSCRRGRCARCGDRSPHPAPHRDPRSTQVQPEVVMLAMAFASLVGVFFGWYPANRAARLDVIEALRYE
jgi:putative ABC transport system permease protein